MNSGFIAKGTEILRQAIQKDNQEQYESALSLYSQGIQYLMTGLKYEKNQKVIEAIKKQAQKYLQRAEDIKASLDYEHLIVDQDLTIPQKKPLRSAAYVCNDFDDSDEDSDEFSSDDFGEEDDEFPGLQAMMKHVYDMLFVVYA